MAFVQGGGGDFSMGDEDGGLEQSNAAEKALHQLEMRYTALKDSLAPHKVWRWAGTGVCFLIYAVRVYYIQGWYIVTYALGIYYLNLMIAFLSPLVDPSEQSELPTSEQDAAEFKPFVRRLPEFKCWHSVTRGLFFAFAATFFSVFNIPVFWPILVLYFFALLIMTLRRQIEHMMKHKYVPFSFGKPQFKGKPDS
uniref:Protein RER1 n=1 Tax=Hemiselmis andersenii TaxID=464988 RepID=A0A6T8LKR8_HEMAN